MDEVDLDLIRDMLRYSRTAIRLLGSASAETFAEDERTYLAVWQALQVVGEAASRVSPATRRELPGIPWSQVIGMRHHLVHGYRQVRAEIVVRTVREDLPLLAEALDSAVGSSGS
jgi:uncharacterized protein with HEPN domain